MKVHRSCIIRRTINTVYLSTLITTKIFIRDSLRIFVLLSFPKCRSSDLTCTISASKIQSCKVALSMSPLAGPGGIYSLHTFLSFSFLPCFLTTSRCIVLTREGPQLVDFDFVEQILIPRVVNIRVFNAMRKIFDVVITVAAILLAISDGLFGNVPNKSGSVFGKLQTAA